MVLDQIAARGVTDQSVLAAMRTVPRHRFVLAADLADAYTDGPLPIGRDQTISQPYIVAAMTEMLQLHPTDRVLEIGTGCGYQTAVLAEIADHVWTLERIEELQQASAKRLKALGYRNISLTVGDGFAGWPEEAPFDAILVTAAAPRLPRRLIEQLADGGRLVLPLAQGRGQQLIRLTRTSSGLEREDFFAVRFVPMLEDTESN